MIRTIALALALALPTAAPANTNDLQIELCDMYATMAEIVMELRQTQPDYETASSAWMAYGAGSVSAESNRVILLLLSVAYTDMDALPLSKRRQAAEGFANIVRTQCLAGAFNDL